MYLQVITYLFMLNALLIGINKNKYVKRSTEKAFVYYLIFTVVNEAIVKTLFCLKINSYFFINLYEIVTFVFFIIWYYIILNSKRLIIKYLFFIYIIIIILSINNNNNLEISNFYALITTLVLVVMYYNSLLNKEKVVNYLSEPKFWFSSGILIYQVGFLPVSIYIMINKEQQINIDIFTLTLSAIFYGCFIKGFLCYKK